MEVAERVKVRAVHSVLGRRRGENVSEIKREGGKEEERGGEEGMIT